MFTPRLGRVPISTLGWIVFGLTAWLAVGGLVGVLIGRMVRERDRQVPHDDDVSGRASSGR